MSEYPSEFQISPEVPEKEPEIKSEKFFDTPKKIERLEQRTAELIEKIIEDDVRLVVFLDNSARPLSWMLRAAWDKYAPGHELPKIKFVNIGNEKRNIYFDANRFEPDDEHYKNADKWVNDVINYWEQMNGAEYIKKVRRDIRGLFEKKEVDGKMSGGELLLVDDFSGSGFTKEIATGFFKYNFPDIKVDFHALLRKTDSIVFQGKDNWMGTHLPWNTDKTLTFLTEPDNPGDIISKAERDPEKRKKAAALKKEIEEIFKK